MYLIKYHFENKIIGSEKFETIEEARENYAESDSFHEADFYEIINSETFEVVYEQEIVQPEDIIDQMFDGEESKEGFDWTLGQ